jgi:ribosomal protein L11 methyltransferase
MPWIQLKISADSKSAEHIGDRLTDAGALSVTMKDNADTPVLEPLPGETPLWGETQVVGLFDAAVDTNNVVSQLRNELHNRHYQFEALEDKDWIRAWMDHYKPMKFGKHLWIVPTGYQIEESDAVEIHLDPGLAFGTGTHPTTALCLEWLDGLPLRDKSIVDFGCGSGILAIAAMKLGATEALCVDIDPQALIATKDNAERNQVPLEKMHLCYPDRLKNFQADVVAANILSGPLEALAPQIAQLCLSGGQLVLSGLLEEQAGNMIQRYQEWFDMDAAVSLEGWVRLTGSKR